MEFPSYIIPTCFLNHSETPDLNSSLNSHQNMSTKSPLPPLPPSTAVEKSRSRLLGSRSRPIAVDGERKHGVAHGPGKDQPAGADMRKLRRRLTNNKAAQVCSLKKRQYIFDMEKEVQKLRGTIAVDAIRLKIEQENHKSLLVNNDLLKKEVQKATDEEILREKKTEYLKFEIQRLKFQNAAPGYVQNPNCTNSNLNLLEQSHPNMSFYQERLQTEQINSAQENVLTDELISSLLGEELVEPATQGNENMDEDDIQQYLNCEDVDLDEIAFL